METKMPAILTMTDKQIADAIRGLVFETTLGKRNGTPTTLQIVADELPMNAFIAIAMYGGQRYVNDRVGGSDTTHETKVEDAKALIARLKAGDVGRAVKTGVDEVTRIARLIVKAWAKTDDGKAKIKANAKLAAMFAENEDAAIELVANGNSFRAAAEKKIADKIAEKKKMAAFDVEVDL